MATTTTSDVSQKSSPERFENRSWLGGGGVNGKCFWLECVWRRRQLVLAGVNLLRCCVAAYSAYTAYSAYAAYDATGTAVAACVSAVAPSLMLLLQ